MAFSERSGRKVSEYRKQHRYSTQNVVLSAGGATASMFFPLVQEPNRVTQVKHLRGFVTVAPTSQVATKFGVGWVGLIRYVATESIGPLDLKIEASYVLHPVAFSVAGYPQSIPYEYEAITLGPFEKLVGVVNFTQGNQNLFVATSILWDERKQITD